MALPRGARLPPLLPLAALLALLACGTAGDSTTPATCAGCEGALCRGGCTDLSAALAAAVRASLPPSACVPPSSVQGATVCTGQICPACTGDPCPAGGPAGCTLALAFGPIALGRDTHLLEGTVTASAPVDAHLTATDCVATMTATLSYRAGVTFACAPGAETATFGTITTTVDGSSVSLGTCGLLATYLELFRPTFEATAESAAKDALAAATASVTATCP